MNAIEERIKNRIKELEEARDQFVKAANIEVGKYEGAISELQDLLKSEDEVEAERNAQAAEIKEKMQKAGEAKDERGGV